MRLALKLLSPFLFKVFRRYAPGITGIDHERLARGRHRLVSALMLAALSLMLFAAALLTAIIDAALQFEQRGALEMNVVMMSAAGTFTAAVIAAMCARLRFPKLGDFTRGAPMAPAEAGRRPGPPRRPEYAH